MSETKNFTPSIDRVVEGGLLIVGLVEVVNIYNRLLLPYILEGLHEGFDEEYLSMLTVKYNGPETVVDLTEYRERQDHYPYSDQDLETSTQTIIRMDDWGDDLSRPFITAHQARKTEGNDNGTTYYRCDRPFYDNSLRLGQVMRAARVARGIQHRQRR